MKTLLAVVRAFANTKARVSQMADVRALLGDLCAFVNTKDRINIACKEVNA